MQDPLMPTMPTGTPWWGYILLVLVGGGGLRIVQAILESRKLEKSEYRELLEGQLASQAAQLEAMQDRLDQTQDERLAALERENAALRERIGELERHIGELEARLAAK